MSQFESLLPTQSRSPIYGRLPGGNISWALPSPTCGAQDRFAQPAHVKSFASQEMKEDKINERTKPRHDVDQHDKAGDYTQWSRNA
jgi:hypothetical protein